MPSAPTATEKKNLYSAGLDVKLYQSLKRVCSLISPRETHFILIEMTLNYVSQ